VVSRSGRAELFVVRPPHVPNNATTTAGSPFSFTVDKVGSPVRTITEKGNLAEEVHLHRQRHGTATLSGMPKKADVTDLTIKATFGSGAKRYVVLQAFTLTGVDSG
jgi:hypothetical protein